MPNHMHGVIVIQPSSGSWSNRSSSASTPAALSVIIRSFKAAVTRELRLQNLWDDQPFWQRNYYDRVVRNDHELDRIREYIAHNPVAWQFDHDNPGAITSAVHDALWGWLESGATTA
jgi:REP element-mobilizing transposase RayT